MPKYVPVLVALFLVVGPAADLLQPAQLAPRVGPEAEPHGARTVPLPRVPQVAAEWEPYGARMTPALPVTRVGPEAEPHG